MQSTHDPFDDVRIDEHERALANNYLRKNADAVDFLLGVASRLRGLFQVRLSPTQRLQHRLRLGSR